jgi:hypothetical protein
MGELKDQRVVTMMSPSELQTIDDWMFNNRIRSRGEAIRRLCQIGIIADGTNLMSLAMAAISHYIEADEDQGVKQSLASGETLEVDVKRLCVAVIEERSKMGSFKGRETVDEAIAAALRLSDDYAKARANSPIFNKNEREEP